MIFFAKNVYTQTLIRCSCVIIFLNFIYQVMVATFRCEQIAKETFSRLKSDKVFLSSLFLLTKVIDARIISFVIQLISYRLGWHWEKLLKLVQNRSLGKSSYLFWKTPSPSKCTSCSLFWKAIRSACISSIQCRIKMLQSMH
jgi:hypothetical protein